MAQRLWKHCGLRPLPAPKHHARATRNDIGGHDQGRWSDPSPWAPCPGEPGRRQHHGGLVPSEFAGLALPPSKASKVRWWQMRQGRWQRHNRPHSVQRQGLYVRTGERTSIPTDVWLECAQLQGIAHTQAHHSKDQLFRQSLDLGQTWCRESNNGGSEDESRPVVEKLLGGSLQWKANVGHYEPNWPPGSGRFHCVSWGACPSAQTKESTVKIFGRWSGPSWRAGRWSDPSWRSKQLWHSATTAVSTSSTTAGRGAQSSTAGMAQSAAGPSAKENARGVSQGGLLRSRQLAFRVEQHHGPTPEAARKKQWPRPDSSATSATAISPSTSPNWQIALKKGCVGWPPGNEGQRDHLCGHEGCAWPRNTPERDGLAHWHPSIHPQSGVKGGLHSRFAETDPSHDLDAGHRAPQMRGGGGRWFRTAEEEIIGLWHLARYCAWPAGTTSLSWRSATSSTPLRWLAFGNGKNATGATYAATESWPATSKRCWKKQRRGCVLSGWKKINFECQDAVVWPGVRRKMAAVVGPGVLSNVLQSSAHSAGA